MPSEQCPRCHSPRPFGVKFCAQCGYSFNHRGPELRGFAIFVTIVLLVGSLGILFAPIAGVAARRAFATPTPTPVPHIACQQGADLVIERHRTMWGLLYSHVTGWQITCEQPTTDGLLPVALAWDYQGAHHQAIYDVNVYGVVTPANDTARKADQLASLGLAALSGMP